jgi:heme-degrading monooxygenase HmoA
MIEVEGKVRSVLVLQPRGEDVASLLAFFRRHDILGLAIREAGAWSAEVLLPVSGSGPVVVTAVWDSAEAYTGWRTHPARATFADDMQRLVEAEPPPIGGGVYRVAIAAVRS